VSNFLAVATVTETVRQLLQAAIDVDLPGATVTMDRPGDDVTGPQGTRVNVYLYRVTPNPGLRNDDLPTRRPDGLLQERPQAALDLYYLISFFGEEGQLEPQRLLGSVVRTLHGRPVLTRPMIADALASSTFGFLASSDLAAQPELVKLTPAALSLDDLSKLWSVFFETPFVLSVAYEATVVLIEGEETPRAALPVQQRNLRVLPFRQPLVEHVLAQGSPNTPILAGSTLLIRGQRLQGEITLVRLGGNVLTPDSVSDTEVSLALTEPPLPPGAMRAGVQGVQVVQQVVFGTAADPHRGFESNLAPFVLHPSITAVSLAGNQVTITLNPPVRTGQRVSLLLNQRVGAPPAALVFAGTPQPADTATPRFTVSGIVAGEYFVRAQVDGAESPLDLDPASPQFGPTLTFP
jgi:hypothetical protein